MNKDNNFIFKDLTREIINSALEVHNKLGCGLLEKVYENALKHGLSYVKKKLNLKGNLKSIIKKGKSAFIMQI